jgi:hypothetical protein
VGHRAVHLHGYAFIMKDGSHYVPGDYRPTYDQEPALPAKLGDGEQTKLCFTKGFSYGGGFVAIELRDTANKTYRHDFDPETIERLQERAVGEREKAN